MCRVTCCSHSVLAACACGRCVPVHISCGYTGEAILPPTPTEPQHRTRVPEAAQEPPPAEAECRPP
eukprot:11813857-Prorocentrum_lima.AAC.1